MGSNGNWYTPPYTPPNFEPNQQNGPDPQQTWSGDQQQPNFTGVVGDSRETRPVNLTNEAEYRRLQEQGTRRPPNGTQLNPNSREFRPVHRQSATPLGPNRTPQGSNRMPPNQGSTPPGPNRTPPRTPLSPNMRPRSPNGTSPNPNSMTPNQNERTPIPNRTSPTENTTSQGTQRPPKRAHENTGRDSPTTHENKRRARRALEPTPRPYTKEWTNNHLRGKNEIAKGASGDIKLVVGDSIIKHLDKATVLMKGKYENIKWINAGIGGDGVENVHWRIRDYPESAQVSRIVIAAGTNNLFNDSAEEIIQEVENIHETALKNKFPKALIWVQSILPRLNLDAEIEEKIQEINSALL